MSWNEQWSIKIDGVELNDITTYFTEIPEIENIPEDDVVTVPIDGRAPAYIRNQPVEAHYTILIASRPCTWEMWSTRITSLKALLTRGSHTLTVQVRGMAAAASTTVVIKGMMIEAKNRRVAVSLVAMTPIL